uniref:Reverse transcriptase domain-containing protein n=1 Tax=Aceria tosichella TaxID=561515 RepID=A0A6G1SHN4_9ACAR
MATIDKIISFNSDRHLSSFDDALGLLSTEKPSLLLMQDVPYKEDRSEHQDRLGDHSAEYEIFCQDEAELNQSTHHSRDNVIIAKKSLNAEPIVDSSAHAWMSKSETSVFGVIVNDSLAKKMVVFSIYIRPKESFEQVRRAFNWMIEQTKKVTSTRNLIILGDFNSYDLAWAREFSNYLLPHNTMKGRKAMFNGQSEMFETHTIKHSRGRIVTSFCASNRLKILNDVEKGPTFMRQHGKNYTTSYIDLAIAGSKAAYKLPVFSVIDLHGDSYHNAIMISQGLPVKSRTILTNRVRNFGALGKNGDKFKTILTECGPILANWRTKSCDDQIDAMNKAADILTSNLGQLKDEMLVEERVVKPSAKFRFARRINRNSMRLIAMVRKKRSIKKTLRSVDKNCQSYKKTKKRLVNQSKGVRKRYEKIKRLVSSSSSSSNGRRENYDDSKFSSPDELDLFLSEHYPIELEDTDSQRQRSLLSYNSAEPIILSDEEISQSFNLVFPPNKHFPPARVDHLIFRSAYAQVDSVINEICRISLRCATVPTACRLVEGLLLTDDEEGDDSNFRLIHKAQPLLCLLEKIVARRFNRLLVVEDLFNPNIYSQPRYRQDDMYVGINHIYREYILLKERHRNIKLTIYKLSIESVYESVSHEFLISTLDEDLLDNPLRHWIANYLSSRHIKVSTSNSLQSSEFYVTSGIFQGSLLSNSLLNYILHALRAGMHLDETGNHNAFIYMDNIYLTYFGRNREYEGRFFVAFQAYLRRMGLRLLDERCSSLRTGSDGHHAISLVRINGNIIEESDYIDILGLKFFKAGLKLQEDSIREFINGDFAHKIRELHQLKDLPLDHKAARIANFIKTSISNSIFCRMRSALGTTRGAMSSCEDIIIRSIKLALCITPHTSKELIKLILGLPGLKFSFIEWVIKRISLGSNRKVVESYVTLLRQYDSQLCEKFDLEQNAPRLFVNHSVDTIHPDPAHVVRVSGYSIYVVNFWTVIEHGGKHFSLVHVIDKQIVTVKQIKHSLYDTAKYNYLATLFHLFGSDVSKPRNFMFNPGNEEIKSIMNIECADWKAVKLREMIWVNNWSFIKCKQRCISEIEGRLDADRGLRIDKLILGKPNADDQVARNMLFAKLAELKKKHLDENHTPITKAICEDVSIWSKKVNFLSLGSNDLICLSGLHLRENEMKKNDLGANELPPGCNQADGCDLNNNCNTLLHRLFTCPRYDAQRMRLKVKLGLEPTVQLEGNLVGVVSDARKRRILLDYMKKLNKNIN